MSTEKKYRRSAVSVICYILAAVLLVYVCYLIGSTVATINEYYAQYGMKAQPSEYVTYISQSALEPLFYTIAVFMFGFILDAVRKNNPANFVSDAEIEDAKAAKKEAKDAKKFAKGEAAAEKAGHKTTDEASVEADFAKSFDEDLKAEMKSDATVYHKPKAQRKPKQNSQKKPAADKKKADESKSKASDNKEAGNKGTEKKSGSSKSGGQSKGRSQGAKGASKKTTKPAQKKESQAPKKEPKRENAAVATKEEAEKAADGFAVVIEEGKE